ncbi:MAG TPA: DUF4388 domain-containing protein [Ktedonobacteraceae bacterium]|nr:DUF4388 domain-containing protein [Ktedonobacteraceae bacterium]
MPQQPATSTDRLANVIEVIQLGRKTGVLTAERNAGTLLEQGMITFVKGQVTLASAGQYSGFPAFSVLKTWGACRFAFTPLDAARTTQPLIAITGETPTPGGFSTDPTLRARAPANHKPSGPITPGVPGMVGAISNPAEGGLPYPVLPYDEALVWIERMRFSRAHRQLFLLIDGHRSTAELVRLTGRGEGEVYALLRDLEVAGVIGQI